MNPASALSQYQQVDVQTSIVDARPHKLIEMLYRGVLDKLATAKGFMSRKELSKQGENISKAIRIIDTLRASLDHKQGGQIATNLQALYDYMERRLTKANMDSDVEIVDEVISLVEKIASGWDAIPEEYR